MSRLVNCTKLKKSAEGLDYPPYPGKLGERVFQNISKQAWQEWLNHQTMLINEHRLNLMDAEARQFLEQEMEKFLFEGGAEKPAGYVPPEGKG